MEAEKTGIKIVESPYVVSFRDMTKYFKPGLPFDFTVRLLPLAQPPPAYPLVYSVKASPPKLLFSLQVQVSHHDGSPASNVPVNVNLLDTPLLVSGSARVTVNMLKHPFPQSITVRRLAVGRWINAAC